MVTSEQILANRANAQLSTGPSSVEGKAASKMNAVKYGLYAESLVIPGEDPDKLELLTREYHASFQPFGPVEHVLVEMMTHADWLRRRWARVETEIWNALLAEEDGPGMA